MKKIHLRILLLGIPFLLSGCTTFYYQKANKEYDRMAYDKAIKYYEAALSKKEISDARVNLAHAYRLVNNSEKAEIEYRKVIQSSGSKEENWFYLSKMMMMNNKHTEAKAWLDAYLATRPSDSLAISLCRSCNKALVAMQDSSLYIIKRVELEGVVSAFAPVLYKKGIVFSGNIDASRAKKIDPWTGKSYLNLFYTEKSEAGKWSEPVALQGDINTNYHEGAAAFNNEGNVIFFTRSNYYQKKLRKDEQDVNNLKMFKATLNEGKWTGIVPAPFISDSYSVGHPSLSEDGSKMYFVSDMPGGYGGTDIYECTVMGDSMSAPRNLGPGINTPGNEMFPTYSSKDSSLYFSSEGHDNLGGLDIFRAKLNGNGWSVPENMGYPLNTTKDDFAYVENLDGVTGYFSSNRDGADQVYEFRKNEPDRHPVFYLAGMITLKNKKVPLPDVTVTAVEIPGDIVSTVLSDSAGMYSMKLEASKKYKVYARKNMHYTANVELSTEGKTQSELLQQDFDIEPIVMQKAIVLENIFYDYDKWDIRADAAAGLDKLVNILKDNPEIKIELSSHTDARGNDKYNLTLSEKRAKAAVDYIVSKGIDASRLVAKGYGETKLVNHCGNGVKCSPEEEGQNRRTEFKVIKIEGMQEVASGN
jgi:outer membrane protein OmpA-like peptidoglycan-associated protein/tetratricopeptide (TPR) repeat protein